MLEGGHINHPGILKLRTVLTDESNVLGWDPGLLETREALLTMVVEVIEQAERDAAQWTAEYGKYLSGERDG